MKARKSPSGTSGPESSPPPSFSLQFGILYLLMGFTALFFHPHIYAGYFIMSALETIKWLMERLR